jgi:beta-lactamase class A
MRLSTVLLFIWLNLTPGFALAASLNTICIDTRLAILTTNVSGRIGICVSDGQSAASLHGDQQFPLYGVSELPVAVAVLDAVDSSQLHLDSVVTRQPDDQGSAAQLQARSVGHHGAKTTIQDLLVRMLADSDRAATDFLIKKLGGPRVVQSVLVKKGIRGFKIDLNEQDTPSFASQHHNTATPIAVANLLQRLVNGWLLSPRSSALLLETMVKTHDFPDRLKAGVPTGWLLAHKTGTGTSTHGVSGASNDVGILMAPDGSGFVVAVVLWSKSRWSDQNQAALIANAPPWRRR